MARHGFGRGEYKYFRYPLPAPICALREQLYGFLAPQANRWNEQMNLPITYPAHHADFMKASTSSCGSALGLPV